MAQYTLYDEDGNRYGAYTSYYTMIDELYALIKRDTEDVGEELDEWVIRDSVDEFYVVKDEDGNTVDNVEIRACVLNEYYREQEEVWKAEEEMMKDTWSNQEIADRLDRMQLSDRAREMINCTDFAILAELYGDMTAEQIETLAEEQEKWDAEYELKGGE